MPYLNFKELAARLDIEEVASSLSLDLKKSGKEWRGHCPACNSDDARALSVMPETRSFRCYAAQLSGDVIALAAHINGTRMYDAARELDKQFGSASAVATSPQKPEGRKQPAPNHIPDARKMVAFDPDKFLAKLTYTDEVAALGFTEDEAARLAVGWHSQRKKVYFALRNPDGSISGFIALKSGELEMPPKWIGTNVIALRRA